MLNTNQVQSSPMGEMYQFMARAQSRIDELSMKVEALSEELLKRSSSPQATWMHIKQAAEILQISPDALRQRIKGKASQFPENVVWKQQGHRCSILVNLQEYYNYL